MDKRTVAHVLFLLLSTGALSACGSNDHLDDLRKYMNEIKKENPNPQPAKSAPKPLTEAHVTYKAATMRAPFHLPEEDASNPQAAMTPLQAFPLSVLKFVGTAAEGSSVTAYILTPNNMIFQVRKGDVIGEHYGKIIDIQPSLLQIEEPGTGDGDNDSNIVVLQLKDNNG